MNGAVGTTTGQLDLVIVKNLLVFFMKVLDRKRFKTVLSKSGLLFTVVGHELLVLGLVEIVFRY